MYVTQVLQKEQQINDKLDKPNFEGKLSDHNDIVETFNKNFISVA
jgi:hypothetical protein